MSWQTKSVMEQKILFIKMWESGDYTMSSLCKQFRISRPTGYKLINRYLREGEGCLGVNSRAPISTPHKTPEIVENAIIRLRKKYPNWGARKLKVLLEKKFKKQKIPSETTINAILKRNDLITSKRRRNPKEGKLYAESGCTDPPIPESTDPTISEY